VSTLERILQAQQLLEKSANFLDPQHTLHKSRKLIPTDQLTL